MSTPVRTREDSSSGDQNAEDLHQSLVVKAGNSFSLHCSSPVETTFRWAYCPVGGRESKVIYNTNRINYIFPVAEKARVSSCGAINCTLNVDNVQLGDAGFFTCMPRSVETYWSLTVIQGK